MFVCFYCHKTAESNGQQNVDFESFDKIENMEAHRAANHGSQELQFFAIGAAACFYCDKVDSFQELQNHHRIEHENKRFVVVDQQCRSNCGLCQKSIEFPTEMEEHFKRYHQQYSFNGVFNPICFTQIEVDWLLKLGQNEKPDKFSAFERFECGWCREQKDAKTSTLERHLKSDIFSFTCSYRCKFDTKEIKDLIDHARKAHPSEDRSLRFENEFRERLKRIYFRTKLLFSNGLVMFRQNVLKTKFDDYGVFLEFTEHFAKRKFDEHLKSVTIPSKIVETNTENNSPKTIDYFQNELLVQRRFYRNVCISGVFDIVNDQEILMKFFLDLCKVIKVNLGNNDVRGIHKDNSGIIVKMADFKKKKKVLTAWREAQDLKEFPNKLKSFQTSYNEVHAKYLSIEAHYSHFYKPICYEAEKARTDKQIHLFRFTKDGLTVKVNLKSKEEIIWSISDLRKLIERSNNFN